VGRRFQKQMAYITGVLRRRAPHLIGHLRTARKAAAPPDFYPSDIPALDPRRREDVFCPYTQEKAYLRGTYDYLRALALVPKHAVIAGYVNRLASRRVLDMGCGTAELLAHLALGVAYTGIDLSPAAIGAAKARYGDRPNTRFIAGDFSCAPMPSLTFDCIVWSGVGWTWTRAGGRGSDVNDLNRVVDRAGGHLEPGGHFIFEAIPGWWETLERAFYADYVLITSCDLHCHQCRETPRRDIRVLRRRAPGEAR